MKIIVYSVNIGGYDYFNEPKIIDKNIRYILFTDNKYYKSNIWEVNHVDFLNNLDDRMKSRFIKLNPHKVLPNHDVNLWVDGNLQLKINNFNTFLEKINYSNNIMLYKHRLRNCLYDEGKRVVELKKDFSNIVHRQMSKYKNEGFPKNLGLYETGFMVRPNNNKIINKFNEEWWNEVSNHSGRDQLSQMYVSWKTGINIDPIKIGKSAYENNFTLPHNHSKEFLVK
jgi:hypothetical protein